MRFIWGANEAGDKHIRRLAVLEDGHMRIEGVVYASVLWLEIVDHLSGDLDGSAGDVFESGDHPESGGLAAT